MRLLAVGCAAAFILAGSAHAAPQDEVIAAFTRSIEKGAYHAVIEGGGMRTEMQVQLPDRFHMKSPQAEVIVLPQGSWINAGGQWMPAPMDMSGMIQGFNRKAIEDGMATVRDVRVLREETVGGCASTVYGYQADGRAVGVDSSVDAEVAVCSDNGLPVRVVSKPAGGPPTTVTYDYDTPVDIEPPM